MKKNKDNEKSEEDENEESSEDEEDEENDEESSEDENLENIVNTSANYPSRTSKEQAIAPNLEISNQSQRLESELRNVPANTSEENTGQSSQYSLNSSYMSNSYQSSSYSSSVYPESIKPQDTANPFDSSPAQFRNPGIFKNNTASDSEGYPKETEIRKYDSPSEQKRDKKRY